MNLTERGFTYHEMVDHLGLVNMNGRLYDPLLGRFLSADPTLQFPGNFQNYNRYSYVHNNPLSHTDPSGFSIGSFFKKFWRPILAIVLTIVTAGAMAWMLGYGALGSGLGLMSGIQGVLTGTLTAYGASMSLAGALMAIGAVAGFVGGLVATGSLKGAAFGALSGAAASAIGNAFQGGWAGKLGKFRELSRAMAHGICGGVISDVQGGKFGSGFLSASFSSMASSYGPANGSEAYTPKLIQAAVAGGTGSVIGGGKFEKPKTKDLYEEMNILYPQQ